MGNGTTTSSNKPVPVTLPGGVTSFNNIRVGGNTACGIGNNDRVYCWGSNSHGQFGNNTNAGTVNSPALVGALMSLPGGVTHFTDVSVSSNSHVCVIGNDGNAYCAGENGYSKLSVAAGGFHQILQLVPLPGGVTSFTKIAAGANNTCAIANTGDV